VPAKLKNKKNFDPFAFIEKEKKCAFRKRFSQVRHGLAAKEAIRDAGLIKAE